MTLHILLVVSVLRILALAGIIGAPTRVLACTAFGYGIHIGEIRTIQNHSDTLLYVRIDPTPCFDRCYNHPRCFEPGNSCPSTILNQSSLGNPKSGLVDLATGRVSPADELLLQQLPLNPLPHRETNVTAGYSLQFQGQNLSLLDSNGSIEAAFEYPSQYYWEDFRSHFFVTPTFFVSSRLQKAYIFMEERRCAVQKALQVAIVDLSNTVGAANKTMFVSTFISENENMPYGFDCYLTGTTAVEAIYEDVQIMALPGYDGLCSRNTYLFYNETNVHVTTQSAFFESWDMVDAIFQPTQSLGAAHEAHGFLVRHEYKWSASELEAIDTCYPADLPGLEEFWTCNYCPENYTIDEINISTGELVRTIVLNRSDIQSFFLSDDETIGNGNTSSANVSESDLPFPEIETTTIEYTEDVIFDACYNHEGTALCKQVCAPGSCCYNSDETCPNDGSILCDKYEPCQVLSQAGGNGILSQGEAACADLTDLTQCVEFCSMGTCCFTEDMSKACEVTAPQTVCTDFTACEILYKGPNNP